jgi:catechol 2,3-dioxygenase-like lactoylglutathione lyase family enzyme
LLRGYIPDVSFDHVAHAVPQWQDLWGRYAVELGGEWRFHGYGVGFAPCQLRFANGARIELLMPHEPANNDFLVRFLASNGPGSHHLTFKVPNLDVALQKAKNAGFEPIGVRREDPKWMEAFLHPKHAMGILVQLAEVGAPLISSPPDEFPQARRQRRDGSDSVPQASLVEVVHVVADLQAARNLFVGLLGARVASSGRNRNHRLRLRLVAPLDDEGNGPVDDWLQAKPGRVHHLVFEVEEPESIPGALPATSDWLGVDKEVIGACWSIDPSENAGLGLLLLPTR